MERRSIMPNVMTPAWLPRYGVGGQPLHAMRFIDPPPRSGEGSLRQVEHRHVRIAARNKYIDESGCAPPMSMIAESKVAPADLRTARGLPETS
jgi:hypothetical protein